MELKEATKMNFYRVVSKDRLAQVESTSLEMAVAQFNKSDVRDVCWLTQRGPSFGLFCMMDAKGYETDEVISVWKI